MRAKGGDVDPASEDGQSMDCAAGYEVHHGLAASQPNRFIS